MVMAKSGRVSTKKLKNGSFNKKGRIFDHVGPAMDPINVEPIYSAPIALVPYNTSKEVPVTDTFGHQSPSLIKESPNV